MFSWCFSALSLPPCPPKSTADLGIHQIWSCSGEPNALEQVPAADICSEYRSFVGHLCLLFRSINLFNTTNNAALINFYILFYKCVRLPGGLTEISKNRAAVSCLIN